MSARHQPVGWNRTKWIYDGVLLAGVVGYVLAFLNLGPMLQPARTPLDEQTQAIRAWGSCGFILLSLVLAIGPLARLDRRFLPLLYNRRHFGVLTFCVALAHALEVLGWYFAYSETPPLQAMLASDGSFGQVRGFPFIPFGIVALLLLFALAATSHDFWLSFLTPAGWKALHMAVYGAYALVVLHVAFGQLQSATDPLLAVLVVGSVAMLVSLHIAAGRRAVAGDQAAPGDAQWVRAGPAAAIAEGRAIVVRPPGAEPVAIFRHLGKLSAVTNLCAHQNGPLGEGRIVDGCITCPWHGFQYRLEDGCAPPPYTEKLATYRLKLEGDQLLLDPRPNPPGTRVEPVAVP